MKLFFATLLILSATLAWAADPPVMPGDRLPAQLVRVVDGDTIVALVRGLQVKVRLAGIDAPEMKTEAGKTAKAALVRLLPDSFTLEAGQDYYDKRPDCWDRYGRLIGWLWISDRLINEEMVDGGNAQVRYLRESSRYWERMRE